MKMFRIALATAALMGGTSVSAQAADIIYTENFNSPVFIGSLVIPGSGDSATSDRWADTDYYTINDVAAGPGTNAWTFNNNDLLAEEAVGEVGTGDGALEINEPSGVATTVVGLTAGQSYSL